MTTLKAFTSLMLSDCALCKVHMQAVLPDPMHRVRHCERPACPPDPLILFCMQGLPMPFLMTRLIHAQFASSFLNVSSHPFTLGKLTVFVVGQIGNTTGRCNPDMNQRGVVVMVSDSCPECASYHWDMQALTYAKVCSCPPLSA